MSIISLYKSIAGEEPLKVIPLAQAGSNRRYYRLSGPVLTAVGCEGTDLKENDTFLYLSAVFGQLQLPVPKVLAVDDSRSCYLMEDLGDVSLLDFINAHRDENGELDDKAMDMLRQTVQTLPRFQMSLKALTDFNPDRTFADIIRWDLNYFKYCFLKPSGLDFDEVLLQQDFDRLESDVMTMSPTGFLYRDFQTRNVMVTDGKPRFIDYQGGMKGPVHYDVATMLWQSRASIPQKSRDALIDDYILALSSHIPAVDTAKFRSELKVMALFRTLQVLGAYGFRGLIEHRSRFVECIPAAIAMLRGLVQEPELLDKFTAIADIAERLATLPRFAPRVKTDRLTVRVSSFSYRQGIPDDFSGNGGGFVFDCRAIHNPGRYEQYKHLTGRDEPVIRFLEDDGEVTRFLEHVYALVDASVERYMRRGFTDLLVSFGCTGGRHRSVYCAEHTARHLAERYDITVILNHREQNITETCRQ